MGYKFCLADLEYVLALELSSKLLFGHHASKNKLVYADYSNHKENRQRKAYHVIRLQRLFIDTAQMRLFYNKTLIALFTEVRIKTWHNWVFSLMLLLYNLITFYWKFLLTRRLYLCPYIRRLLS